MGLSRMLSGVVAASSVALALGACSNSGEPGGTAQDFTGSYTLVSFAQGTPAGVVAVPGTTGTVTLTATHYDVSLSIPLGGGLPPLTVSDQGTYSAIGAATSGTFTQQSTLDPSLQYAGTYSVDPATNRLTMDTTAQGVRTVIVLQQT